MSNILVLSEEFVKRILVGLGEIPAKFSHEVILEVEAQLKAAKDEAHKVVAFVETHLEPLKAKVSADAAAVKTEVSDIKAVPVAVEAVVEAVEKAA
jgi:hypothetical protein